MGESLKDLIGRLHGLKATPGQGADEMLDPYYFPRYIAWLKRPESERRWSASALEHARKVFAGEYAKPRENRISPSGFGGKCLRETLFSFAGAPKLPSPWQSEALMEDGGFDHLKWQMIGLSAGFLTDVEGFRHVPELRLGGSRDGVGDDDSLFELKNTAEHLYKAIVTGNGSAANYARDMVEKHKTQMEAYWLLDELTDGVLAPFGSLVYVNRANPADIHEVRIRPSEERRAKVHAILEEAHDYIDVDELPDLLEGCQASLGWLARSPTSSEQTTYSRCQYREHCPTATSVVSQ